MREVYNKIAGAIYKAYFMFSACLLFFCYTFNANAVSIGAIDSRIKVFNYDPNAVYDLPITVGFQTVVKFANNETVDIISLGDPNMWKITPIGNELYIKTNGPGVRTNMKVNTNKREYFFNLTSNIDANSIGDDIIFALRFVYPKESIEKSFYSFSDYLAQKNSDTVTPPEIEGEQSYNGKDKVQMNIDYSIEGNESRITPVEVFDDGKLTFFRFIDKDNIPNFYTSNKNKMKKIEYYKADNYFVVDGVYQNFILKLDKDQNTIYNNKFPTK